VNLVVAGAAATVFEGFRLAKRIFGGLLREGLRVPNLSPI